MGGLDRAEGRRPRFTLDGFFIRVAALFATEVTAFIRSNVRVDQNRK